MCFRDPKWHEHQTEPQGSNGAQRWQPLKGAVKDALILPLLSWQPLIRDPGLQRPLPFFETFPGGRIRQKGPDFLGLSETVIYAQKPETHLTNNVRGHG